jgi:imidazole glycerol-phosphate synthase subunit HisH
VKTLLIDYGSGNIRSAAKALEATGYTVTVSADPKQISQHDLLVLPGQGHFGQVMRSFAESGFEEGLRDHIASGKAFLGICVGMQILYENSTEAPEIRGLGLIPSSLERFKAPRVPQIGWNMVDFTHTFSSDYFYFVHSYYAIPDVSSTGKSHYAGTPFVAMHTQDNLVAPQFHPEKSGAAGLRLLQEIKAYFKQL